MMYKKLRFSALLCAALSVTACGDDDDALPLDAGTAVDASMPAVMQENPAAGTPADAGVVPMPGVDAGGQVPATPAVYAAATRIFSTDGAQTTTYVQVLSSIGEGAKLETAKATELGGPAELFALDAPRWLAIGDGESPLLSRYTATADQKLQKQETVSFQNYGLQSFFSNKLYQVSATKVYLPDPDSAQLFAIDPANMKVLGAVSLPDTTREGYTPVYSYDYALREGKLLFTVAWFDWTNDKIRPETGLVVLDTATDKVARMDVDTRCGGITQPITLASGDTYFPSSSLAAASYQLGRLSTEPCALRIKAGADAFDPTYHGKLRELVGGAVAGEPVPAGGDELFLRVLDVSLASIEAATASYDLTGQSAWTWSRWNPITGSLVKVEALKPSTANTSWFEVDGRVFNSETTSDYASTTLVELTAAGGPKNALTAPGLISGLARIQ